MPYILNTDKDIQEMLKVIGAKSVQDLYAHLPPSILLKDPLNLPSGLSELSTREVMKELAAKNMPIAECNSFLGAGCYDHFVPSAIKYLIERCEFLTAYTPYQAECSQGTLQAIYEYQSYMCLLTGMAVSNASLFDAASGTAEAVLMALRITQKKRILLASTIHPEYRKTLETYLSGLDFEIKEITWNNDGSVDSTYLQSVMDESCACLVVQSPNFFGVVEDVSELLTKTKAKGILNIMIANPFSLALLKEPAALGFDIVCGDGQSLGGGLNLGGPSFGYLTTKREFLRQMPGRIVGKTIDKEGKTAYCLTLQAREQHIRREKATSNICSNQSLNAIAATMYLALMGREGLSQAAQYSLNLTHYLYRRMQEIKEVTFPFTSRFFNEFVWQVDNAQEIIKELYKKKIIPGYYISDVYPQLRNAVLSCCTEKKTKDDVDAFVESLKSILQRSKQ